LVDKFKKKSKKTTKFSLKYVKKGQLDPYKKSEKKQWVRIVYFSAHLESGLKEIKKEILG
jgi:hypothetical protein